MKTYVVGHKNPDTDSVVSAIAYANLIDAIPAAAGSLNKETLFLLERFGFTAPEILPADEKQVYLVDTSNPEEFAENLKPEEVVGIVDHHKLGGLKTAEPIPVTVKPVGCTATVLAQLFKENEQEISKEMAGIMLGAILSDTLKFTSPTTTEADKKAAEELTLIAEAELDNLASEMFAAKSDISDVKTADLIGADYKVFEMAEKKVGIGVWETTLPHVVLERREEILNEMQSRKTAESLDLIFFFCVDILNTKSDLFITSQAEEEVAQKAFGATSSNGIIELPGVVSRKKQMTPIIERALS